MENMYTRNSLEPRHGQALCFGKVKRWFQGYVCRGVSPLNLVVQRAESVLVRLPKASFIFNRARGYGWTQREEINWLGPVIGTFADNAPPHLGVGYRCRQPPLQVNIWKKTGLLLSTTTSRIHNISETASFDKKETDDAPFDSSIIIAPHWLESATHKSSWACQYLEASAGFKLLSIDSTSDANFLLMLHALRRKRNSRNRGGCFFSPYVLGMRVGHIAWPGLAFFISATIFCAADQVVSLAERTKGKQLWSDGSNDGSPVLERASLLNWYP